jgi:hypothetical protein
MPEVSFLWPLFYSVMHKHNGSFRFLKLTVVKFVLGNHPPTTGLHQKGTHVKSVLYEGSIMQSSGQLSLGQLKKAVLVGGGGGEGVPRSSFSPDPPPLESMPSSLV